MPHFVLFLKFSVIGTGWGVSPPPHTKAEFWEVLFKENFKQNNSFRQQQYFQQSIHSSTNQKRSLVIAQNNIFGTVLTLFPYRKLGDELFENKYNPMPLSQTLYFKSQL